MTRTGTASVRGGLVGRLLTWCIAAPVSFALVAAPTYFWRLITKNEIVDLFTTQGADRYMPFAVFTLAWALVMATVVTVVTAGWRTVSRERPPPTV